MTKLLLPHNKLLTYTSDIMNTLYYGSKLKILLLLFTLLLLTSCGDKDFQTIHVEHRYKLDVPANFKKVKDLNKEASLQYQNALDELYVIVIDEPKDVLAQAINDNGLQDRYTDDLKGYSKLITDGMESSIAVQKMPPFKELTIGGDKARELSFEGISSGTGVYWKLAFIEGRDHYYQIMVWTLAESRKKHEKKMNTIVNSFIETDKGIKR